MADLGEKVRREKQAVIRKPRVKLAALHCPLAFLSRFTKPGYEPLKVCLYKQSGTACSRYLVALFYITVKPWVCIWGMDRHCHHFGDSGASGL